MIRFPERERMGRNRWKPVLRGTTIVAVLIGIGLVVRLATRVNQVFRLPNGVELWCLGVTHGPSNVFVPGGIPGKLIYYFAPAKGINIGPLIIPPVTPVIYDLRKKDGTQAFTNNAVV
jgi:hypothetical protein